LYALLRRGGDVEAASEQSKRVTCDPALFLSLVLLVADLQHDQGQGQQPQPNPLQQLLQQMRQLLQDQPQQLQQQALQMLQQQPQPASSSTNHALLENFLYVF
jgi:hypothetical protein